jgi:hypothetical protein
MQIGKLIAAEVRVAKLLPYRSRNVLKSSEIKMQCPAIKEIFESSNVTTEVML